MISPYYYGQYSWPNYLQDVQRNQESSIGLEEKHVYQNDQMLKAAGHQLGELQEQTLELRNISETLQMGFEEMRAEFNWGFTLMVERLDEQIDLLSRIAERLDAIHKTLQSPLMTQARELFLIGQDRFKKGLRDKALEAYLMAEQKNDVDFPLQLQSGKLYLYETTEDFRLVDVAKADKHLAFAVRVAEAESDSLPDWSRNCGEAHFHAAVAAYLSGEQEQRSDAEEGRRQCLERALGHLARSVSLWPQFTESVYLQAKCRSLLGQGRSAIEALTILSDRDRRYYAKASKDHDFDSLRLQLDETFRRAIVQPGSLAKSTDDLVAKAFGVLEWARRSKPGQSSEVQRLDSIANGLEKGRALLGTLNVDIEGLHSEVSGSLRELDEITMHMLGGRVEEIRARLKEAESKRASAQHFVEHIRDEMKKTEGSKGWGCLSIAVVYIGISSLTSMMLAVPSIREFVKTLPNNLSFLFILGEIALAILGYRYGVALSKTSKNLSNQRLLDENLRTGQSCGPVIAQLKQEEAKAEAAFRPYLDWRLANGIG